MNFTFISHSQDETMIFGRILGETLKPGSVIGLIGDLGAGKTCFIKGLAYGINRISENEVTSPTFNILQEYEGRFPLYHFDAYRLSGVADLEAVGFEDYIYGDGISVIEWADRIIDALPGECLLVYIEMINEHSRLFTFKTLCNQYDEILEKMKNNLGKKF
jgi:tRNA threonylcarbamoyladenosine biosynthesis protein TsaE